MIIRSIAAAALAALSVCGTAFAAPVTVHVRVEGGSATLFERPVTTDGRAVDGSDGTGAHPCGTGPTATTALDDASKIGGFGWLGNWDQGFGDFLIDRIGAERNDLATFKFWGYAVNFVAPPVGGCQRQVAQGDEVVWAYDSSCNCPPDYTKPFLRLSGPSQATVNESMTVTVVDGKTGFPMGGAVVAGRTTRFNGQARISFTSPGVNAVKAERTGSIRSNALTVCVVPVRGGDCGATPAQLGDSGSSSDSIPPVARILRPRSGVRYSRGPRLLRGTVSDSASGVQMVELSLRRRTSGAGCTWWSGVRERFVRKNCRTASFFEAGAGPKWSYLLPRRLPRGRYVLDVNAVDRAGNRQTQVIRARTRVVFEVRARRGR